MDLSETSKVMHAARLVLNGSFSSQKHACVALNIEHLNGRVSDACTIVTRGCPELIAGVESGRLPFATGWHIARNVPYEGQLSALSAVQMTENGRNRHGLYAGRPDKVRKKHTNAQAKLQDRACEAVDKLLEAICERADALAVCTNGIRVEPEPEQGRNWRKWMRRCRKALTKLDKSVDWTKTEILEGAGETHDASNNGTQ